MSDINVIAKLKFMIIRKIGKKLILIFCLMWYHTNSNTNCHKTKKVSEFSPRLIKLASIKKRYVTSYPKHPNGM